MKKVYEKPQVYMERFELSQNVALCDYQLDSQDGNSCTIIVDRVDEGEDFVGGFLQVGPCNKITNIYCYTNGSSNPSIFVS